MIKKLHCAISVDVDSMWVLSRFHGHDCNFSGKEQDVVYKVAIPRFLELFDRHNLKATFFVVGNDCKSSSNKVLLKKIISSGHEIGNHSMNHPFGFSTLTNKEKETEIKDSGRIIEDSCGYKPVGFRVPGYNVDEYTIDILDNEKYLYDSSVYPFLPYSIMCRLSYLKSGCIPFGKLFEGSVQGLMQSFSPFGVYSPKHGKFWREGQGRNISEIPLSVMPLFKIPFNSTFLFLAGSKLFDLGFSKTLSKGLSLNYSFHASDMLCSDLTDIPFKHPGMNRSMDEKNILFDYILSKIGNNYDFMTIRELVKQQKN